MNRLVFVCLTGLLVLACSMSGVAATPQQFSPTVNQPGPSAPGLTAEQVQNMPVQLVSADQHPVVQLTNGEYHAGSDPTAAGYADAKLVPDRIALGDLNGDGLGDAAVLLAENYGGTGVFVSVVAIVDNNGQPAQVGSSLIDDRPKVTDLQIQDGRIVFSGSVHAPNDPGCCATSPVVETFGLTKGGLQMQRLVSSVPGGTQRSITVDSPANGTQVSGTVEVKGSFTVSPFENTLAYHVVDATGKEWTAGSFQVTPDMGGPGSFDAALDLSKVPSGILVRLEIRDVSAADGSTIAMDSVELMMK